MYADANYPACRFVVLAAPRAGGDRLCALLDSHPRVLCHDELFHPQGIHVARRAGERLDLGSVEARDRDPLGLLDRAWRAHLGHQCVGFALGLGQEPRALDHVLSDPAIRKIVLRHRNRVRTFVAEALAARGAAREGDAGSPPPAEPRPLTVPAATLRAHAERNAAFYAAVQRRLVAAGRPWIEATPERLAEPAERERILAFLGVARAPLVETTRGAQPPLRDLVANFEELREALRGSELEEELCAEG